MMKIQNFILQNKEIIFAMSKKFDPVAQIKKKKKTLSLLKHETKHFLATTKAT